MVRYYIQEKVGIGSLVQYEVFPLNDSELGIEYKQDEEQFFFREHLNQSVLIQRDDSGFWSYIKWVEASNNQTLDFIVKDLCDGRWSVIWTGEFDVNNCEFDNDQCTVLIDVRPLDEYTEFLRDYEVQYNILEELPNEILTRFYYQPGASINYEYGRLLLEIAEFFASNTGLSFQSDFFVNGDPIAGQELDSITFHQKSDIKHPTASQNATQENLSFKEFIDILNGMFDVFWSIEGTTLRIEHRRYYKNGKSYAGTPGIDIDLTLPFFRVTKTNKYKYLDLEMPWREEWQYSEVSSDGFYKGWIEYDSVNTNKEVKTRTVNAVTNVYNVWLNFDKYSDSGWVVLYNHKIVNNYYVISNSAAANYPLVWYYLFIAYWTYDRVKLNGTINGSTPVVFDSVRENREQVEIEFQYCCHTFDPLKLITTDMGNGRVRTASKRFKDSKFKVQLRYEPI